MKTHILDIILVIPLLWGLIRGFMRGLVFELALLAALVLASISSFFLADRASEYLITTFSISGSWLPILSHILIFAIIYFLVYLLGKALTNVISSVGLGILNRFMGGIFGVVKWTVVISLFVFLIKTYDVNRSIVTDETREESYLFKPVSEVASLLSDIVRKTKVPKPEY